MHVRVVCTAGWAWVRIARCSRRAISRGVVLLIREEVNQLIWAHAAPCCVHLIKHAGLIAAVCSVHLLHLLVLRDANVLYNSLRRVLGLLVARVAEAGSEEEEEEATRARARSSGKASTSGAAESAKRKRQVAQVGSGGC